MFSGKNIGDVLTKTTWQGFNPFGLMFVLAWTVAMLAVMNVMSGHGLLMRRAVIGASGLVLALIDFIWRYRQTPQDSLWRFGSEFAGGSMMWVPAWLWMIFISAIAATYWVGE